MQVNPLSAAGVDSPAGRTNLLLIPELLSLMGLSPQGQSLLEERADKDQQRADERHRQVLAAGGLGPQTPLDAALEAERRLAPGSHAARQRLRADLQSQSFRRSLSQARQQGQSPGAARNSGPKAASLESAKSTNSNTEKSSPTDKQPNAATPPDSSRLTGGKETANTARNSAPVANNTVEMPQLAGRAVAVTPAEPASTGSRMGALMSARSVGSISPGQGTSRDTGQSGTTNITKANTGVRASASPIADSAITRTAPGRSADKANTTAGARGTDTSRNDANIERILRVVRTQIGAERARATLRLDPPELGTVRMTMDLHKNVLLLRIDTQTPLAHRLLTERIDSLRAGLESAGVQLERVEIRPPLVASPDPGDTTPRPDTRQSGQEGAANPDAEQPNDTGTEANSTSPAEQPEREFIQEPATESLVNILA
ncbi:MAG: flagellar hook-length control protein FliK [Planctomycetota bacterium]